MALTALDLFCGAGGLSCGLVRAGFKVAGAIDASTTAVETYALNFDHPAISADLSVLSGQAVREQFDLGDSTLDLVAGGPPCQGFSIQRIGRDQDERNDLVGEFARLVCELRPRAFLMENVPGLLGRRGESQARAFEQRLRTAGYVVKVSRVNAADYGAPQKRLRIFYYGWLASEKLDLTFAAPVNPAVVTVWDAISDLESPPQNYSPAPGDPLHRRMRLSAKNIERLQALPPGGGMQDLPVALRVACHRNGAERIGHRYVYGRLAADKPAGTITARFDSFTRGKFAHPFDDRNITLREGARLQTFPDTFRFLGSQEAIASLIGNAVPPVVASSLATSLAAALSGQLGRQSPPSQYSLLDERIGA